MLFLSRRFWLIAAAIASVHLVVFYFVQGIVIFPYSKWRAFQETVNFFVHDIPAVVEGGKVIQPAERHYVVSTALIETNRPVEPAPAL